MAPTGARRALQAATALCAALAAARALAPDGGAPSPEAEALMQRAKQTMPELFRDAPETIRQAGYPVEQHKVHTEDGYILTVHRIPRGRAEANGIVPARRKTPVLLQHGIFGASDSWVVGGPGIAPAYFMADSGYDVWMSNARGNFYSREHVNMTDKNSAFWRFSWHEMGNYDLPAVFDYVLKTTGHNKLIYVGHSMGSTMYYVMLSSKPEYNERTRLQVAVAPAVFWDNVRGPIPKLIRDNHNVIKMIMDRQNTYELLTPSAYRTALYYFGCRKNSSQRKLCNSLYHAAIGKSGTKDQNKVPVHLARMMESTSGLAMLHFAQNAKSGRFCQFDYGTQMNIKRYGMPKPPDYDLKKVTVPVVLYTSQGDDLVPAEGVARLAAALPNVVELYTVPAQIFNHLDFFVHEELHDILIQHILKTMSNY